MVVEGEGGTIIYKHTLVVSAKKMGWPSDHSSLYLLQKTTCACPEGDTNCAALSYKEN